jgi:hypothetical protein
MVVLFLIIPQCPVFIASHNYSSLCNGSAAAWGHSYARQGKYDMKVGQLSTNTRMDAANSCIRGCIRGWHFAISAGKYQ